MKGARVRSACRFWSSGEAGSKRSSPWGQRHWQMPSLELIGLIGRICSKIYRIKLNLCPAGLIENHTDEACLTLLITVYNSDSKIFIDYNPFIIIIKYQLYFLFSISVKWFLFCHINYFVLHFRFHIQVIYSFSLTFT